MAMEFVSLDNHVGVVGREILDEDLVVAVSKMPVS